MSASSLSAPAAPVRPVIVAPPVRIAQPTLVVVDRGDDVALLHALAAVWRQVDPQLPDLVDYQRRGLIAFLPINARSARELAAWAVRLDAVRLPRFHLHQRGTAPEARRRQAAVAAIDRQANRCGRLTAKRALVNYLHPSALVAAGGPRTAFGDRDDVVAGVAAARLAAAGVGLRWRDLNAATQQRLRRRAQLWLAREVVARMTPELAALRDPHGETPQWLRDLQDLATW